MVVQTIQNASLLKNNKEVYIKTRGYTAKTAPASFS